MRSAAEIERRARAIILRAAGDDPFLRMLFTEFADALKPDLARWASKIAAPPDPSPSPAPMSARAKTLRAKKVERDLRALDAAIARGEYVHRDAAAATMEDALRSCVERLGAGYRELRRRQAAGALADEAAVVAYFDRVTDEATAALAHGLGLEGRTE
jgi:hypothetical protein